MKGSPAPRARKRIWALLAAAIALRAAFFVLLPSIEEYSASYIQPALGLLRAGHYSSFDTLLRLPGAPLFFALCFLAAGVRPLAAIFIQHAMGVVSLWLLVDAARRAWGERAALLTGVVFLLQLQLPYRECFLLSETLGHFFLALSLHLAIRLRERPAAALWRYGAAGLAASAAALTRGEYVVIGPVVAAALAARGGPSGRRGAALLLALWALPVGGWVARNRLLFGYSGLTPDSVTTMLDTALPLVRYDLPSEPLAKKVLAEEVRRADGPVSIDPRATTIERLQRENGYSGLQAELAVGRVSREAVLSSPFAYLWRASPHLLQYLLPARWTRLYTGQVPTLDEAAARGPVHAAFARLLRWENVWDWLTLALAALSWIGWRKASPLGRWAAGLAAAGYLALWLTLGLTDTRVPRIQAELYIPLGMLAGFALNSFAARSSAASGRASSRSST